MQNSYTNKVVLVTGGTSGIGKATALAFAEAGAKVVLTGRREKEGADVAAAITKNGGTAAFVRADVAKDADLQKALLEFVLSTRRRVRCAFNNAGVEIVGPLDQVTEEQYRRTFDINVWGVLNSMKHEIAAMLQTGGGAIVNTSSVAGHIALPQASLYVATKHAVEGLTKAVALEFAKQGIRVNSVAPGTIATDMVNPMRWQKQAMRGTGYCRCIRSAGSAPAKKSPLPSSTLLRTPRSLPQAPRCWSTEVRPLSSRSDRREELMKLLISFMTAVGEVLGLACAVLGDDNYAALAAQGYRWVTVNGPYACNIEQDVQRITAHHTDAAELQVVQNIQCYYLIPGTIVQVIKEDPARGMSEMRLGSVTRFLWTYSTDSSSKRPIKDTYGVVETPESSALIPTADTATVPELPSDRSTARTRPNGNP